MKRIQIIGSECGWDKNGLFHCSCGKCKLLDADISEYGGNGGNYCCDSTYDSDHKSNKKPSVFSFLF